MARILSRTQYPHDNICLLHTTPHSPAAVASVVAGSGWMSTNGSRPMDCLTSIKSLLPAGASCACCQLQLWTNTACPATNCVVHEGNAVAGHATCRAARTAHSPIRVQLISRHHTTAADATSAAHCNSATRASFESTIQTTDPPYQALGIGPWLRNPARYYQQYAPAMINDWQRTPTPYKQRTRPLVP